MWILQEKTISCSCLDKSGLTEIFHWNTHSEILFQSLFNYSVDKSTSWTTCFTKNTFKNISKYFNLILGIFVMLLCMVIIENYCLVTDRISEQFLAFFFKNMFNTKVCFLLVYKYIISYLKPQIFFSLFLVFREFQFKLLSWRKQEKIYF